MRTIEFRAKYIDNSGWVYGYLTQCYIEVGDKLPLEIKIKGSGATYFINENTIGQFTGLYDKNGKKIFEGDIVKVKLTQKEDINLYETKYKIGFVAYDENFCLFYLKNNFMKFINWAFNNINGKEIEVIGNIYDNPELLNGE